MINGQDEQLAPAQPDTPPSRRSFLGTLAAASAAFVAAVLGFTSKAQAEVRVACCNLCKSPVGSGCANVNGTWAWSCCLPQNGTRYSCVEYYRTDPNYEAYERQQNCTYIYGCSTYFRIGSC
ncbi:MAG TPA: twin-arginine translocation signal domain-containing protein [Thermoanaerobaculia bacterium]|nr:twin-arginine translocation signal domain-containing protein [Thermoanaerobaculia bacterium]